MIQWSVCHCHLLRHHFPWYAIWRGTRTDGMWMECWLKMRRMSSKNLFSPCAEQWLTFVNRLKLSLFFIATAFMWRLVKSAGIGTPILKQSPSVLVFVSNYIYEKRSAVCQRVSPFSLLFLQCTSTGSSQRTFYRVKDHMPALYCSFKAYIGYSTVTKQHSIQVHTFIHWTALLYAFHQ
jgi:sialic acid synthase SpsE